MSSRFLLFCLLMISGSVAAQQNTYMLVGTYTSGKSEGIYVYRFDENTGAVTAVSSVKVSNPSFLAISPDQQYVYAVNENADSTRFLVSGNISAYSFNAQDGSLKLLNTQLSGGKHPCYVATDQTGRYVFAGNYSNGSVAVLPVKPDGSLDSAIQVIEHSGSGPDMGRQKSPHVHSTVVSADNRFLFVPDLGIDKVMVYEFNAQKGRLYPAQPPFAASQPGSGPRHFDIHPNHEYAYLMEELTGTVAAYQYSLGILTPIQRIQALDKKFKGKISSADIHVSPDGRFLYCSNRGESNTITIFSININTGKLTRIKEQPVLGLTPRNFSISPNGNFLLVANQNSDNIVVFKRDKNTGLLTDTGTRVDVPNPVCIKWIQ
jgi:6-phosphogluconolactonase